MSRIFRVEYTETAIQEFSRKFRHFYKKNIEKIPAFEMFRRDFDNQQRTKSWMVEMVHKPGNRE